MAVFLRWGISLPGLTSLEYSHFYLDFMLLTFENKNLVITEGVAANLQKLRMAVEEFDSSEGYSVKSKPRNLLHETLLERLEYLPETGVFIWKIGQLKGMPAGCLSVSRGKEYIRIRVQGELILAHVLAWFYVHRQWPKSELDHLNGDGTDNRITNLELSNRLKNNSNTGKRSDAKEHASVMNVKSGRFAAIAKFNKCSYWLGTYNTLEEALLIKEAANSVIPRGIAHKR